MFSNQHRNTCHRSTKFGSIKFKIFRLQLNKMVHLAVMETKEPKRTLGQQRYKSFLWKEYRDVCILNTFLSQE